MGRPEPGSAEAPPTATPEGGPPTSAIRVEVADAIATITLHRPDALNAVTGPMLADLLAAFRRIARDRAVRAVVLTGAGRAFCAGQDLKERLAPEAPPLAVVVRERYNPIITAMRTLDQPIVGAINGVAAGAGASLAFACDVRLAADTASFALAFGRIGLVPDSGATWFLPRLVGPAKAAELALTGATLSATEAERFGLVAKVVPAETLAAAARDVAAKLGALAPVALAQTKRALERSWSLDLETALEEEAWRQGIAGATEDHAEGLTAFIEKRPPHFRGS
jgi:2-(1,2-epoxy-1,2-dihydrophenyl)acetyl-CoA isomerase